MTHQVFYTRNFGNYQIIETGKNIYIDFLNAIADMSKERYFNITPSGICAATEKLYMHNSQEHKFMGLVSIYDLRFL